MCRASSLSGGLGSVQFLGPWARVRDGEFPLLVRGLGDTPRSEECSRGLSEAHIFPLPLSPSLSLALLLSPSLSFSLLLSPSLSFSLSLSSSPPCSSAHYTSPRPKGNPATVQTEPRSDSWDRSPVELPSQPGRDGVMGAGVLVGDV